MVKRYWEIPEIDEWEELELAARQACYPDFVCVPRICRPLWCYPYYCVPAIFR